MAPPPLRALHDPGLSATVRARTPLYYTEGADPVLDRPASARSGPALVWFRGRLAVVQDDAQFSAPGLRRSSARWSYRALGR